jgi:uncharacterized protein (TIGR02147 family)
LRAFARDLEVSATTLSDFFNGRVGFSRETTSFIAKKINLSEDHKQHMWNLIEMQFARDIKKRKEAEFRTQSRLQDRYNQVSLDAFRFVADWYHLAILELVDLDSSYQSPKVLSKALGISHKEAQEALQRLINLKLLKQEGDQKLVSVSTTTNVGDGVSSEAVRLFHSQILAKAHAALENQSTEEREISSTIFSIAKEDLPEIKKELNAAWFNIASKYSAKTKKDSLYCLSLQFFDMLEAGADGKPKRGNP